jgi:hypothetical protein
VRLRSYHWCGLGAAQRLLVRLRSYHWGGSGAAQLVLVRVPRRISRAGVQVLKRCNHSHSEFLCSFWKFFVKCFPMIIAAQALLRSSYWLATQLLLACYAALIGLLRSSISAATQLYQRCYAALTGLLRSSISAATQLLLACYAALSALLRSYYWRCYHGGSAEVAVKRGRGRLRRPCREEHEEKDTEKCKRNVLVFPVITALMSSLKLNPRISSAPMPAAHTFIRSISDRPG